MSFIKNQICLPSWNLIAFLNAIYLFLILVLHTVFVACRVVLLDVMAWDSEIITVLYGVSLIITLPAIHLPPAMLCRMSKFLTHFAKYGNVSAHTLL